MENLYVLISRKRKQLRFEFNLNQPSIIPDVIELATEIIEDGIKFGTTPAEEPFRPSDSDFAFRIFFALNFKYTKDLELFRTYLKGTGLIH